VPWTRGRTLCRFIALVATVVHITVDEARRPEISVVQVVAGALAAVSSAVLASTLGVEGTIIGAAVGSIVVTAGGALYAWSLERTRTGVATGAASLAAIARSRARTGRGPRAPVPDGAARPVPPDRQPQASRVSTEQDAATNEPRRGPRWWKVGLAALAAFVLAMAAITAIELLAGKPLAAEVGGKEVSGTSLNPQRGPAPTPTESPTEEPSGPGSTVESPPDASPTPETTTPATPTQTPTLSPTMPNPGGTPG
jgi:hypothetical protein